MTTTRLSEERRLSELPGDAPLVEHALIYAALGWELMPRREVRGRLLDAVTGSPRTGLVGEAEIAAYWRDHPETPALAVVCGPQSNVFVVDVDQHGDTDGLAELRKLEAVRGRLPATPFVLSPSGAGRHLYFRWPAGQRLKNRPIAPGIEILGSRMAANLPPSTKARTPYRWSLARHVDYLPIAEAPAWLLRLAAPPPPPRVPRRDPHQIQVADRYVGAALEAEVDAIRSARPRRPQQPAEPFCLVAWPFRAATRA